MAVFKEALDNMISALAVDLNDENFMKFQDMAKSYSKSNPELNLIAEKARVALRKAEEDTWIYLYEHFVRINEIYPAICCAEAIFINNKKTGIDAQYKQLVGIYQKRKKKEIDKVKSKFLKNFSNIKISVIVPTFNRPEKLKQAIESVLNQTFKNFELIIVNDGGSKDCESTIRSFKNNKIRYCYMRHGGLSQALNQGILQSRSQYISYLDDDDRYYPDHLEIVVAALEDSDFACVYTDGYRITFKTDSGSEKPVSKEIPYSVSFNPGMLSEWNYIPNLCMAHRRDCFEKTGLFESNLPNMMDWDMWVNISRFFDFKHINRVTCEYELRKSVDSLSGNRLNHQFYQILLEKHFNYQASEMWKVLSQKKNQYGFKQMEKNISRYTDNQYQLSLWLLPIALQEGEWKRANGLIGKTTMAESLPHVFMIVRYLFRKCSLKEFLFSLLVFKLHLVFRFWKYVKRKVTLPDGK